MYSGEWSLLKHFRFENFPMRFINSIAFFIFAFPSETKQLNIAHFELQQLGEDILWSFR